MLRLRGVPRSPQQQDAMDHTKGELRRAEEQLAEAVMMGRLAGVGINTNGVATKTLVSAKS